MKRWVLTTVAAFAPGAFAVPTTADLTPIAADPPARPQFVSTVKVTVRETTPELRARAQRIVREQFVGTLSTFPSLRNIPYEISSRGDEVVFSMVTPTDTRAVMQEAMAAIFDGLNWRTNSHGQMRIYKATFDQPAQDDRAFLSVEVDESRTKIRSIAARSVPLRLLLEELQSQLGDFSYLIPGECRNRLVDWQYGGPLQPNAPPKEVHQLMDELATFFGVKFDRTHGTFIFSGTCKDAAVNVGGPSAVPIPQEVAFPANWVVMPQVAPERVELRPMPSRLPVQAAGPGLRAVRAERPAVFFRLRPFE